MTAPTYDACDRCQQVAELNADYVCADCREPTDNEIANRYGVEGGIGYGPEPAYSEHDWRL